MLGTCRNHTCECTPSRTKPLHAQCLPASSSLRPESHPHSCRCCPRCRPRRSRRPCRQHSLPDQRSLAGTSNATAAGVTLPRGTMRRTSSWAAARRRSHHPTARHQGGWAALRCPGRPVPSLQQAFELRSGHRRAPCPPSRGACAFQSLWRGRGTSHPIVVKLSFGLWIESRRS